MRTVETLLSELGESARKETPPQVDIRLRVLSTIAARRSAPKLDLVPIALSGVMLTVAVMVFISCFPSWQTMFDPWASYFPVVNHS